MEVNNVLIVSGGDNISGYSLRGGGCHSFTIHLCSAELHYEQEEGERSISVQSGHHFPI